MSSMPRFMTGSSDPVARLMRYEDFEKIRVIDRDAFERYRRQHHQLQRPLQLRTPENMEAALSRPFPGVVVEWPRGTVAGYCFTHVWGAVGWLGTLGVTPRRQGMRLGQLVIRAGLDLLRQAGCTILALETMPESGKNLALYTRLGLEARQLTVLCQGTPQPAPRTTFREWREGPALAAIAGELVPGLDPTPAAEWLRCEQAGATVVWERAGRPAAFAIVRSASRRMGGYQSFFTVEAAACLPEAASDWPLYLRELQAFARDSGKSGLVLPINTRQQWLLNFALEAGMRIVHTRVRMAAGDPLGDANAILMLTLAM